MPGYANQRPTQRQIAARVGVSVTTVSRILNPDEPHPERWASPQTVAAIQTAAADLGYRRNALAVSLRTSRSQTVGVLMPVVGEYVLSTIFAGVDEAAREHGMTAISASTMDEPGLRAERTLSLIDRLVDGMIFADAHSDERFLDDLAAQGVPFTLVHRHHAHHTSVSADDAAAGRLAAEHFIRQGRRRLAMIASRSFMPTGGDRERGFVQAALEAGLEKPRVVHFGYQVSEGRDAAYALLANRPYPDAIFAMHDLGALGALSVLRESGLATPDDVAVVGYYDTPLAAAEGLSSVGTELRYMGRRSLELLLDRLAGQETESETVPVKLIIRQSSGGPRPTG